MLIVDGSVLLSPYVLTILRGIEPSNLAIADTLDKAIGGASDPSFTPLADFYGVHGSLGEALRKWAYQCSRQLWSKQYRIVKPPDDEKAATIFNYLLRRFGPLQSPGDRTIVCMLLEQMWGAIEEGWPILALGSPTPRVWDMVEKLFPEQISKTDLRLIAVDLTAEFREYGIPTVVLAELDPWLIDVLAPSPTMVEYLRPGEFVGKLKFVGFSIGRGNSDDSVD